MQAQRGTGSFLSFYRYFLKRLFHEGLSAPEAERAAELDNLIGRVPYLNGGLFDVHQLEEQNLEIDIPDEAFAKLFAFFDSYHWHLDDRPLSEGNEINPDVLGYIFEKYINQKQMGAYYTKEDITEYISKNTIVPFLLDAASKDCAIAFRPGEGSVWRLLSNDPDRYIYLSVRHGVNEPLPADIAAGINDVSKREGWNRPAPPSFALPTETWREHITRRQRCEELWLKIADGQVTSVNDLVTLNLNIRQFIQDAIEQSEGPDLLRALFKAIEKVTVLDPACGSGAFLFAALNILQPLYDACLDRMESFLDDLDRLEPEHDQRRFSDFCRILVNVAKHHNRAYFVLKSIILHNLYGVDIMEEAVEICKLRLFLKLVAQVETYDQIEPLPDIDFNVRAGNSLVGFSTYEDALQAFKLDLDSVLPRVEEAAKDAARAFERFHEMQTEYGMSASEFREAKESVRQRLNALGSELDRHLAGQYGIDPNNNAAFTSWQKSHEPFHWFVEFYGIMASGGFDAIIGNPPYVEYSKVKEAYRLKDYATESTGNLYSYVLERCLALRSYRQGWLSVIVPVSLASAARFGPMRREFIKQRSPMWMSHFSNRPSQLFKGAQNRLTIVVLGSIGKSALYSTRYHRWSEPDGGRDYLFANMNYITVDELTEGDSPICKVGDPIARSIIDKMRRQPVLGRDIQRNSEYPVYWVRVPGYFCQFFIQPPRSRPESGKDWQMRGELQSIHLSSVESQKLAHSALNSSTFFLYYDAYTDGRHINPSDVHDFPLGLGKFLQDDSKRLADLSSRLEQAMKINTVEWRKSGLIIESVQSGACKPEIDLIDESLAGHYGLSTEELDYILNYDVKYRTGARSEDAESED